MIPPLANDTMFVTLWAACGPLRPNGVIAVTTRRGCRSRIASALGSTGAVRGRPSTTTSAAAEQRVQRRAVGGDAALATREVGVLVHRQAGLADLYDVGPVAGEEVGAQPGGEAATELDHTDAGERQVVGAHRSNVAVSTPRASVWPYIVKPTKAGIESTVAPVFSTSSAWTTNT